MGYARHIGRVGALAVTLGVGVALASSPGVAYAEPSTTSSTTDTPSQNTSPADDPAPGNAQEDTDPPDSAEDEGDPAADEDLEDEDAEEDIDEDLDEDADDEQAGGEDVDTPAVTDEEDSDGDYSVEQGATANRAVTTDVGDLDDKSDDDGDVTVTDNDVELADTVVTPTAAAGTVTTAKTTSTQTTPTATIPPATAPAPLAKKKPTLVSVVSDFLAALFKPAASKRTPTAPVQTPAGLAMLGAVRDELERNARLKSGNVLAPQPISLLADDTPNVLVIGVDGTNLSRVLAPGTDNDSFLAVMNGGTTAPVSIVGHTTVSNPSWTAILTGQWGEKTGVINNVFTPWTYDKFPTVFNYLENADPSIVTTSIADWNVISGIADAGGEFGAENVININQEPGDTDWLLTDDKVGDATEAAIAGADLSKANFVFSYFVGVDENGHMYGGASEQYKKAIENFDRNLGEILEEVANSDEEWTIILVTDHGHQPQKGLGHGFQSPDETATFVIIDSAGFTPGTINVNYEIVDVTPTVLQLFGVDIPDGLDGETMIDVGGDLTPEPGELQSDVLDVIGTYGYPDIGTNLALSARTIFAFIPYYIDNFTIGISDSLQSIADLDIFLISPLAKLLVVTVDIIGDIAYVGTNILAQIVARLTGVEGASIFPLYRPDPPVFEDPEQTTTVTIALLCGDPGSSAAWWCGDGAAVAV